MNRENVFAPPYAGAADRVNAFLRGVYGWMAAGLAITAVTALLVAATPALVYAIATNRLLFWGIIIAQLGIVFGLSARAQHLAPATASLLFIVYSALTGLTMSVILLAYTGESVATTFMVDSGDVRRARVLRDRDAPRPVGLGSFLFMGLIGVVLASIVGLFWQNDMLQFLISFIGVIVFTGLTVYDAQRLKAMALATPSGQIGSYQVVGALTLYLDFINLFLFLLRFTGSRRD